MTTSSNMNMNNLSVGALARAATKNAQGNYNAAFPVLRPTTLKTGDAKLGDSDLFVAADRHAPMLRISPCVPITDDLPNGVGINNNSFYLAVLDGQHPTSDINPVSTKDRSQARAAAAVSAADYASVMPSQDGSSSTAPSRRRKPNFAEKLHAVLSRRECRHAVAWLPSGRSFCIFDQDEFVKSVLPKYFREAKFESFSRRLKRWGFRKVYTTGLSQTIFSHDLFHRDRPDLCKLMNGRKKAAPSELKNDEDVPGTAYSAVPFPGQDQFRNVMTFQQAQEQKQLLREVSFQQQMLAAAQPRGHSRSRVGSLQNSLQSVQSRVTLQGSSSTEAQAMINNALVARSLSQANANDFQLNPQNPSQLHRAKIQLTRLSDNIANCEEQLAILQRLKELKKKHRQLTGACNAPRCVIPCFGVCRNDDQVTPVTRAQFSIFG